MDTNKTEKENIISVELCGGKMPEKAHAADAAFDVFAREDVVLHPFSRVAVPLGFKIGLPVGVAALIQPRSGMSLKGMVVSVCKGKCKSSVRVDADVLLGLIDSGYAGEVKAILRVGGGSVEERRVLYDGDVYIKKGTKVAQMRLVSVPDISLSVGSVSDVTMRGKGGLGSTGDYER